jgi:hypothetical protein
MKWHWCHHLICSICNSKLKNHSWLPEAFMKWNHFQKNDWVRDWNWLNIPYPLAGISNSNDGSDSVTAKQVGYVLNSTILARNDSCQASSKFIIVWALQHAFGRCLNFMYATWSCTFLNHNSTITFALKINTPTLSHVLN